MCQDTVPTWFSLIAVRYAKVESYAKDLHLQIETAPFSSYSSVKWVVKHGDLRGFDSPQYVHMFGEAIFWLRTA